LWKKKNAQVTSNPPSQSLAASSYVLIDNALTVISWFCNININIQASYPYSLRPQDPRRAVDKSTTYKLDLYPGYILLIPPKWSNSERSISTRHHLWGVPEVLSRVLHQLFNEAINYCYSFGHYSLSQIIEDNGLCTF
jgi:hypothetical protein